MTSIFESTQLPDGSWSWSIVSKMKDMLEIAELNYGERDKSITLLGIELTAVENPYLWYADVNGKYVTIRINKKCIEDMEKAVFQVSQEVIHCLSPIVGLSANVLEEGLATHFGNEYYRNQGFSTWNIKDPQYVDALMLVEQLFAIDPDIIKKLRQTEPTISKISKELLLASNPSIPEELADELTKTF